MRFTDGFWQNRPGVEMLRAKEARSIETRASEQGDEVIVIAPTKVIAARGDTLNRPVLTVTLSSPAPDVVTVRVEHHRPGGPARPAQLLGAVPGAGVARTEGETTSLTSGDL